MDVVSFGTWIIGILIFIAFYWYFSIPKNLPPGSAGIPIVGYLPFLSIEAHLTFDKLRKKFGDVYHLYMGTQLVLVLNDYQSINQALVKQGDVFAGRSPSSEFEEVNGEHSGLIMTDGEYWKQHRRFILRNLRDYGVGKLALEPLILNEIQHFIKELSKHVGKGNFEIKDNLSYSLTNNIHILVNGRRYDYDHPAIKKMVESFKEFERIGQVFPFETFFPLLKPIIRILDSKRAKALWKTKKVFLDNIEDIVNETKKRFVNDENENYVQAYLSERNKRLQTNSNEQIFTELGLLHNTRDLIGAGTDTSATTLAWAALYMAKFTKNTEKSSR